MVVISGGGDGSVGSGCVEVAAVVVALFRISHDETMFLIKEIPGQTIVLFLACVSGTVLSNSIC